ncbi:MAG: fmt [Herbinix sp.]|jgi:methionyl-tRNA formyltransferase|nr:fmt [Herbinix sp.]
MKILFMGTPDFAAHILEKLIQSGHEMIGVVTQPDKEKGRGKNVSFPAVKELALQYNLTLYQPVKVREESFLDIVREMAPEVIVVAAFGQLLPKALLDIPPYGCINVHASLLPKYRGAAPIQYSIIEGEKETGVTIMYMDTKIDTGDMILQAKTAIDDNETGGSLYDKLSVLGADLLIEALEGLKNQTAVRIPQDDSEATYVKILDKDMGIINFDVPAVKLERLIRGLNPWPSAYTYLDGKTLKLWQASVESEDTFTNRDNSNQQIYRLAQPGEIIEIRKDSFAVKTSVGVLVVKELQLEGKKRMSADAFLRGYTITVGTKLGILKSNE